jgi:hypothetical protein
MAGMGVLSDLVGHAVGGRSTPDAQAVVSVHHGIGGHDGSVRCDLLPQGGAALGWIQDSVAWRRTPIAGLATAYYFLTSFAPALMTLAEFLELLMAVPLFVWIMGAFVSRSSLDQSRA